MKTARFSQHKYNLDGRNAVFPRGFTLVEMLVVMSMATVLLGMMLVVLSGIIKRISQADSHLSRAGQVEQAGLLLRKLAHESSGIEIESNGEAVTFQAVKTAAKPVALKLAQKPFRLEYTDAGGGRRIIGLEGLERGRFSRLEPAGGKRLAVLELWPDTAQARRLGQGASAYPFRIEAAVGVDTPNQNSGARP